MHLQHDTHAPRGCTQYRAIREKYGALGTFPEIYEKMHILHKIDGVH